MFVRDMANNDSDFAVVKSITEIGHFMGKYVIAEFVENQACLDLLREIGVDFAQGYGIEKPVMLNQLLN
jgi:EAL domain-containing protein (putative c-di-GMP-specific phosphodiesterase class I)